MKKIINFLKKVFIFLIGIFKELFDSKSKVKPIKKEEQEKKASNSESIPKEKLSSNDFYGTTEDPTSRNIEDSLNSKIDSTNNEVKIKENSISNIYYPKEEKIVSKVNKKDIEIPTKINIPNNNVIKDKLTPRIPLKDYFIIKENGYQYLENQNKKRLTCNFSGEICDYQDRFLKIKYQDKYYIYTFNGERISNIGYIDINLYPKFYAIITNDFKLDLRDYLNPDFKLENPIEVSKYSYKDDYKIIKDLNYYNIKIKSTNKSYKVNENGLFMNQTTDNNLVNSYVEDTNKVSNNYIDTLNIATNEEIDNSFIYPIPNIPTIEMPSFKANILDTKANDNANNITIKELPELKKENIEPPKEELQVKDKVDEDITDEEIKNEDKKEIVLNFNEIEQELDSIAIKISNLNNENELEDKNYDTLISEIDKVLKTILKAKNNISDPSKLVKLNELENKAKSIKNNLTIGLEKDIAKEKSYLKEPISASDLQDLKRETEDIYTDYHNSIKEHNLNNIEEIKQKPIPLKENIEKKLIKNTLKKANNASKPSNISIIAILRKNRYFNLLRSCILVNSYLNIYKNILRNTTPTYVPYNTKNILCDYDALASAKSLNETNVCKLEKLDELTRLKYPEMSLDPEYQEYLNNLKNNMLNTEAKILKKSKLIKKYNLFKHTKDLKLNLKKTF